MILSREEKVESVDYLSALLALLDDVRQHSGYWTARCPAHEDKRASLSVARGSKVPVLLKCHAGCSYDDVIFALEGQGLDGINIRRSSRPADGDDGKAETNSSVYPYTDDNGEVLYEIVRAYPKDFFRRRPDDMPVQGFPHTLYRRPALAEARSLGARVYIVEGEKDADALHYRNRYATTLSGGAAAPWKPEYLPLLEGTEVVILPDNDEPGQKHAQKLREAIPGSRIVDLPGLPPKGDVSDWLKAGHTVGELDALVDKGRIVRILSRDLGRSTGSENKQPVKAIPTPFEEWNNACLGFGGREGIALGWHVVIAGLSGNGKSKLARNMAKEGLTNGYSVGYVCLEGSIRDLITDLYCMGKETEGTLHPGRRFSSLKWEECMNAFHGEIGQAKFLMSENARELPQLLRAMNEMADSGVGMIIVDYLQLVRDPSASDPYQEVRSVSNAIVQFAVLRNIATVAVSQFNRNAASTGLTIHGLSGGSAIENDADQVVIIDNSKANRSPGLTEGGALKLAKNRHGPIKEIPVTWDWRRLTVREPPTVSFGRYEV